MLSNCNACVTNFSCGFEKIRIKYWAGRFANCAVMQEKGLPQEHSYNGLDQARTYAAIYLMLGASLQQILPSQITTVFLRDVAKNLLFHCICLLLHFLDRIFKFQRILLVLSSTRQQRFSRPNVCHKSLWFESRLQMFPTKCLCWQYLFQLYGGFVPAVEHFCCLNAFKFLSPHDQFVLMRGKYS